MKRVNNLILGSSGVFLGAALAYFTPSPGPGLSEALLSPSPGLELPEREPVTVVDPLEHQGESGSAQVVGKTEKKLREDFGFSTWTSLEFERLLLGDSELPRRTIAYHYGLAHPDKALRFVQEKIEALSWEERDWMFRGVFHGNTDVMEMGEDLYETDDMLLWFHFKAVGIASMVDTDLQQSFKLFDESGEHIRDAVASHLFHSLAMKDFDTSVSRLSEIEEAPTLMLAFDGIIAALLEAPVERTLAQLPLLIENAGFRASSYEIFYRRRITSPEQGAEFLAVISDPDHRSMIRNAILSLRLESDGEDVCDVIMEELYSGVYGQDAGGVVRWLLERVPLEKAEDLSELVGVISPEQQRESTNSIRTFLRRLARNGNEAEAYEWISGQSELAMQGPILNGFLNSLGPDQALNLWNEKREQLSGSEIELLLPAIAESKSLNVQDLSGLILSSPGFLKRQDDLNEVIESYPRLPQVLLSQVSDSQSVGDIVAVWGKSYPESAIGFLVSGDSREYVELLPMVFNSLLDQNLMQASQWLSSYSGAKKNDLIALMVQRLTTVDPDAAAAWLGEISDPELRETVIRSDGK